MKNTSSETVMGRPRIGVSRQVKITLPEWDWVEIEQLIDRNEYGSMAAYFRSLHDKEHSKKRKSSLKK
ncbi:hypothetical protein NST41_33935 [Paenibacillus sp. FSL L8-0696]|uniref:hypothetical protein n=1 Tax=Paenibacillus sp. FSL L8-0696 TaxID=2954524 RepID=UPI00311A5A33